jgi:hypothetical protein
MRVATLSRSASPLAHHAGFSLRDKPLDVHGPETAVLHCCAGAALLAQRDRRGYALAFCKFRAGGPLARSSGIADHGPRGGER